MAKALEVAREIITYSEGQGRKITNLSLQKLAYFCHGWHLALNHGEPLVEDAVFEAWKFGPVIPILYHQFKYFSSNPIPANTPLLKIVDNLDDRRGQQETIRQVLDAYKDLSSAKLVEISHYDDGPWAAVWDGPEEDVVIENDQIQRYFENIQA